MTERVIFLCRSACQLLLVGQWTRAMRVVPSEPTMGSARSGPFESDGGR
jgi:hypothetical protein